MVQVMSVRDSHGIPVASLPASYSQELNVLSGTINDMLHVISDARNRLKKEQERLSHVINGTRAGTWYWNIQTGETHFNEQWANMLGYQLQELEPVSINTWLQLVHPDDLKTSERQLNDYFAGKLDYYECEARVKHKNGEWVWVLDRGKVAKWTDTGEPLEMYGTHQDVTEFKRNQEQLALAANVYKEVHEGIVITDKNAIILDVNEAFTRITGFAKAEVIGKKSSILSSGRHDTDFYTRLWQSLLTQGYWSGEIWNRRKNGEIYPQLMSISAVPDSSTMASHFVALFSDISSIKEYEKRLEKMAHYDLLTGLPNRFLLSDRLRVAMSGAKRHEHILALLFLDLDGFKEVNDTHGHDMGDRLLVLLAGAMASVLRAEDTLARMGGDEFVMVLPGLESLESVVPVLQRLLTAIATPVTVSDIELVVSASIGVALYPLAEEVDADQLIRQADQAMYQAKLLGKNRYQFFDQARDQSLRNKNSQIARLEEALRDEEFELYYQPQVNLTSQQLVGFEALIRWNHPQDGVTAPGLFLPAIEHHYLMVKIGEWTITQALIQLEIWSDKGINLPVSINLSAIHLQQSDFMARLQKLLDQHPKVDPKLLHFEVLETSALENIVQVQSIITACNALGIAFALDDFGTGYSTLASLKQLPASTLKIDKSFVQNIPNDPDNLLILEAVIGLAKAFKKQVIAEGLEDLSQAQLLLSYGCGLAQGYAIAKPMPAVEVLPWVEQRKVAV
jgi:diguanylate cyclase (GGDEF)-like protein/PAS domain S-box-containing protein